MKNIYQKEITEEVIERINKLSADTPALWGSMDAAQMLAHCGVTYEFVYTDKHKKPNAFMRFMLKAFVKEGVVGAMPYKKNIRTAPAFLVKEKKDFEAEKKQLVDYIRKTQELGEEHFDGKESHSFGPLPIEQWNNMFYKHLDHHLSQFGV